MIDFYPSDVKLDINGARYAWMGVNLLPFLDRERLKFAMEKADGKESKLTPYEQERNKVTGDIRLFFLESSKVSKSAIHNALLEQERRSSSNNQVVSTNSLVLEASFARQDGIAGEVEILSNLSTTGSKGNRELVHG